MNKIYFLAAISITLAGCAAGNVKDIKANPAKAMHLNINQNYQRVYKNVLDKMMECYGEGGTAFILSASQNHVRHEIYNELREANISYVMSNAGYENYYLHIDIKGDGETTRLDAYTYFPTWNSRLDQIKTWATERDTTCDTQKH